jgi:hypothetical protein
LAGAGGSNDNKVIVVVDDGNKDNDDSDEEDNNNEEDNNDDDNVSLSSVLFSKIKFHTNGFVIHQNDWCVFIPSPLKHGGVVINKLFLSFCSSIFDGGCILITPIQTTKNSRLLSQEAGIPLISAFMLNFFLLNSMLHSLSLRRCPPRKIPHSFGFNTKPNLVHATRLAAARRLSYSCIVS